VVLLPQKVNKQFVLELAPELQQVGLTGIIHLEYRNESLIDISSYQPLDADSPSVLFFLPL
jgi:hypothetical protein